MLIWTYQPENWVGCHSTTPNGVQWIKQNVLWKGQMMVRKALTLSRCTLFVNWLILVLMANHFDYDIWNAVLRLLSIIGRTPWTLLLCSFFLPLLCRRQQPSNVSSLRLPCGSEARQNSHVFKTSYYVI